ncbi:hypothetical protein XACN24_05895 [Xanthomonas albilineans]|uniref:hypothetical protein n=1 Tax=Xanthomonas albilineans TaxID=29447 RepID=UPI0011B05998|nr:hypothetical protein [Xanthomonas albilineans]
MNGESKALIQAAMHIKDHAAIIQLVQAAEDPSRFAWEILDLAVEARDEPLVDALLPHLNSVSHSYPLIRAVQRGTASILKKLIRLTEPNLERVMNFEVEMPHFRA